MPTIIPGGVSILVLMDVPLQQGIPALVILYPSHVSILVLMDVPLQRVSPYLTSICSCSFNPCFNGCSSSTGKDNDTKTVTWGFNPCFNGCSSSTKR